MSAIDAAYKDVVRQVLSFGCLRGNRTGIRTRAVSSAYFCYDMTQGFPVLHNKKVSFHTSSVELEGFIHGIKDKKWYQDRGCTIWDEWCNPYNVPAHLKGAERLEAMRKERDLGPIYGHQWRMFDDGCDQLGQLVDTLQHEPDSRRMVVSAWNPSDLPLMALPPCHFAWQVLVIDGKLHLNWNQRSVDVFLGLPYNICMYGLILRILAEEFSYEPGILTGFLGDTHIYENHQDQMEEYLDRPDAEDCRPVLDFSTKFSSIMCFEHKHVKLTGYKPHPAIKAPVAV